MWSPRWSPDGRSIAGISGGQTNKLVLYNLDTGRQTVLLDKPIGYPNWSRDGQYVFANDGGGAGW